MKILKTSIIILACNFLCIFLQLAWSINEKEAYHTLGQNSVSMPTHYVKAKKVKTFVVTKQWNVIADGQTINTVALQKAIDEVSLQGGGKILFPEGLYLTGALLLKSNVELNLDSGAVILGSTNPKDYYTTGSKNYKNVEDKQLALIMASDVSGITLTGKGTIDGQGRTLALAVDSLHLIGEVIDPEYNLNSSRPNENMRPKLFSMADVFGETNQMIPIYHSDDPSKKGFILYLFDSNALNDLPNATLRDDWIKSSQIEWYVKQSKQLTKENNGIPYPALAFFHIPLLEYFTAYNNPQCKPTGYRIESECTAPINSGLFSAFIDCKDVKGVFVGHDHGQFQLIGNQVLYWKESIIRHLRLWLYIRGVYGELSKMLLQKQKSGPNDIVQ